MSVPLREAGAAAQRGQSRERAVKGSWEEAQGKYKHKYETKSIAWGLNAQGLESDCPASKNLWDLQEVT